MPAKSKITSPETPTVIQGRDLFRTPKYAVDLLIPFIPKDTELIWECAAGDLHITKVLQERGFSVFSSDINGKSYNINFILDPFPAFLLTNNTVIITNPPYSLKRRFFDRCIEFDIPFALLIPADYCKWTIEAITVYGCEKIIPTRRIDFIPPFKIGSGADYHSMWLTRKFNLGQTETFVELSIKDKKEK